MEEQCFIGDDPRLFGLLYSPDRPGGRAILIVHPFAEEKKSAQRVLVELAQHLASAGFHVLLFDLRGCGDSQGDMGTASVGGWVEDTAAAADFLRRKSGVSRLSLIGIRLGSYLAGLYASVDLQIDRLLLVAPVFDPVGYLRKSLRGKLMKELITDGQVTSRRDDLLRSLQSGGSVDFDGYPITGLFYRSLQEAADRYGDAIPDRCPPETAVVDITVSSVLSKTGSAVQKAHPGLRIVPLQMEPFWTRIGHVDATVLLSLSAQLLNDGDPVQ